MLQHTHIFISSPTGILPCWVPKSTGPACPHWIQHSRPPPLTITHLPCENLQRSGSGEREGEQASLAGPCGKISQMASFLMQPIMQPRNEVVEQRDQERTCLCKVTFNSARKQPFSLHGGKSLLFEIWTNSGQNSPFTSLLAYLCSRASWFIARLHRCLDWKKMPLVEFILWIRGDLHKVSEQLWRVEEAQVAVGTPKGWETEPGVSQGMGEGQGRLI